MRNVLTIIPKLNEALYNFSKMFQSIVLLKTLQKLIEKVSSLKKSLENDFNSMQSPTNSSIPIN